MTPPEFKAIRAALRISQQGLADRLGVSLGAVRKWEQGERRIPGPVVLLMEMAKKETIRSDTINL
jgi:putative transcriptional regulator